MVLEIGDQFNRLVDSLSGVTFIQTVNLSSVIRMLIEYEGLRQTELYLLFFCK